ncbi:flagellar hook-length control protein FliK [Campylobacter novaezeelandiae]|uniref:flagellar hook-length control protein FliK n=1 Tax=Campylobacter novaezeelandiae TaxID=2267891 RepID=UPI001037C436|nr:flagellar hook-length control protein FliK [Campylobacter novaezeelandiae]TBR79203.1 flagellar hook-length control protein FliK [Campylobacter novaezeelandiae]TBR80981.1 flagellar hook-length control protein FliK [Campylobacter novaezeelandiae]
MSSLTSQNDILNLNSSSNNSKTNFSKTDKMKENKNAEVKDTKNQKESNKEDTEDFLNSLLNSIEETNEFLPDNMKISKKEVLDEALNKLQQGAFDENDKISIFESASFMQILSMLDKLKANSSDIKLGNLSSQLIQTVKTEANFNTLKKANNLSELLNIAKDLGLNVKNIKVDRLLDLKATFPNLDKADFFKNSIDNVFKEIIHNKITHLIKNKESNTSANTKSPLVQNKLKEKNTNSLLSETLKNLDLLIKDKKESKKSNEQDLNETIKTKIKDIKNDILQNQETKKENIKEELKNTKTEIKQEKTESSLKDIKTEADKNLDNKIKDIQKKEQILKQEEIIKQEKIVKNDNLNKNETIKNSQIISSNQKELNINQKDLKQENHKDLKQVSLDQKINPENITDKISKELNKNNNSTFDNNQNKDLNQNSNNQNKEEKSIEKNSEDLNSLIKELSKINHNQTRNATNAKETLQYFSQDLKEAVEQYKAPITKISITLNPSNLGEVEVTLVQRGNNLHINFNSNTNAMNLFIQNQAEFKNSLVNMGFTGLEMNFSDQGKKDQNQNQGKNRSGYGFKDALDSQNEEKINLELVLAKYF